ncbi:hypothetical protein O181_081103 [Austropuccinia psidii MF-1]|uniref:Uncharacterized protein n=1 Tax=Austropuccinia psidii MF-1 TaxID=1389203 RepID=A0A9Q3IH49_9BASI|nr:hypothetical protein [Austropuccinia psidii MF-1]
MEATISPIRWMLTRKRQDKIQIWRVFLKKDMSEGCQSFPHSPGCAPTNFDVNSEPELIQGNILRSEPFPSGSHRNISVPVQKLVQSSQGRGVGNMPKPLAGGYELLLSHQELSGSGEENRTLRMMYPIVLQRQGQKDKELAENQSLSSIDQRSSWK